MSDREILNLPKHTNPTQSNRTASAPYNFVPLPERVVTAVDSVEQLPDHDRYSTERHTGYFAVTLTTRSPLYVRGPFTLVDFLRQERGEDAGLPFREQVKNNPDFFYTCDPSQPVIPGSSLRGMLRSLLEIVSYGKVQWVTDKKLFFRTVDNTAVGKYYNGRLVSGTGTRRDGYRSKAEGGLWCAQPDGSYRIEKCDVTRVEMRDVAMAFGLSAVNDLYDGTGPNATPKWAYQHRTVWVKIDPSEKDHPHSQGRFLRYRKVANIKTAPAAGLVEATLVLTGPMPSKHLAFAFIKQPRPTYIDVPNDQDVRLAARFHDDDQITRWQSHAFPGGQPAGARRERDGYLRDGEPVFFLRESGQLTFFGRAQMFRLPYTQCPLELVPIALRRPKDIDYAEALFGFTRTSREIEDMKGRGLPIPDQGSKTRAYAGRVCVTDATLTEGQRDIWLWSAPRVPKILATPKPTAFQHYLVQTSDDRNTLKHYDSPSQGETVIRGHKLYWHRQANWVSLEEIGKMIEEEKGRLAEIARQEEQGRPDTQHTQLMPVKAGVQFAFRVYFENSSNEELGALCWALHPLGNPSKDYCHTLGMGKPLGMGAIKLDAVLHLTDRKKRYETLFAGDNWQLGGRGTGENLSDPTLLEQRTKPFEKHILETLQQFPQNQHLSDLKRVGMLLQMLEWSGCNPQNVEYMQLKQFLYRPVLPDPSAFGSLTGDTEPLPDSLSQSGRMSTTPQSSHDRGFSSPSTTSSQGTPLPNVPFHGPEPNQSTVTVRKELVTLVEDAKRGKAKIQTVQGELILCSQFPPYPQASAGMQCRAKVTRLDGKAQNATFARWE